jgi:hypothetical protein
MFAVHRQLQRVFHSVSALTGVRESSRMGKRDRQAWDGDSDVLCESTPGLTGGCDGQVSIHVNDGIVGGVCSGRSRK